jgi:hypothetical protein
LLRRFDPGASFIRPALAGNVRGFARVPPRFETAVEWMRGPGAGRHAQ